MSGRLRSSRISDGLVLTAFSFASAPFDGAVDQVARLLEVGADEARDVGFVLDHEDALAHAPTLATRPSAPAPAQPTVVTVVVGGTVAGGGGSRRRRRRCAVHCELEELPDRPRHLAELDRAARSSASSCRSRSATMPAAHLEAAVDADAL